MIENNDLILRMLVEGDLSKIGFTFHNPFSNNLFSRQQFLKLFLENGLWDEKRGVAAVEDRQSGNLLFIFWYSALDTGVLEVGYELLSEDARICEGLKLFSSFLFDIMPANRLQLTVFDYDQKALAVAKSSGFVFEGIMRGAKFFKGKFCDLCIYSRLKLER